MTTHAFPPADGNSLAWHVARTLTLAWPIIGSRAGLFVLFAVDTWMAGQAGGLQLAGFGLGIAILITILFIALGALQSTVVLAAQAIGRGEDRIVGDIMRAGLANAGLAGILIGLTAIGSETVFLATGQDPAVSAIAADVSHQFAWGLPGQLLFITVNLMLEATGRPRAGMAIMLAANVLNFLLDSVFVLGWGGLVEPGGAATAMATSSVVRWLTFAAAITVLFRAARRSGDGYRFLATPADWIGAALRLGGGHGRRIRAMGLPMGLGQGVESAAFGLMVFFAGLVGPTALAAHQTTMTVMSLVFTNAVGLGGAAAIRVGNAVGRRYPVDLQRAGWCAIGLGAMVSGACGVVMVLVPDRIAAFMVDDAGTVAVATAMIRLAGVFVALDAVMGVSMGALRGLGDVWIPMWLQSAAFWIVAVPLGWTLGIHFGFGAIGLFLGIGSGIVASLLLLVPRFRTVSARTAASFGTGRAGSPASPLAVP